MKNTLLVLKSIHKDREETGQMYIVNPIVPVMASLIVPYAVMCLVMTRKDERRFEYS